MRIWQLGMDSFISKARSGCCWTTKTSLEFHRLPGEALCVCSFQCGLSRHGQLCDQRLCVCVCVYFLLCISPPRVCLRAVPTQLIPLILGQAALYRQVSLSLNLAGQKTLFLHSHGCWERLTGIGCVFLNNYSLLLANPI